ncbi:peptide ABC transporter substrate-binding protein [Sansalvadorimonas sp. 2012CJ34-2]|uniref:Peptide ABC transporter substrate-binding protein n=1 Tax=Parendozoicomonas callyspongiae TaxID=2942213 RepID=A0ABT0PC54_9GAMM|nr:peptide ABC transporter substrate-binding protein [Sansalvadorimonas sp. 2012CJ34-2]MCL6268900.1 peptide ABC transporter substrate-binding protein [Sansalvadorimonas sp. 2012CJ34-2]
MRILPAILAVLLSSYIQAETLVRGLATPPATLDPHFFHGTPEAGVLKDLFEGLVIQDEYGLPVPGAAESWQVSEDGRTWTFRLREDLKWSDGTPLTSEDFLFSFRRLADPATGAKYSWYLQLSGVVNSQDVTEGKQPVESLGVTALDKQTLVVTLDEPRSWFPAMMTFPSFLPVPRHAIEACGEDWHLKEGCAVSNGAYSFVSSGHNEIKLQRNTFYSGFSEAQISDLVWKMYQQPLDELVAFRAGDLDITSGLPIVSLLPKAVSVGIATEPEPQLITSYLIVNPKNSTMSNPHLRKALAAVLDRDAVFPDVGGPAWTLTPPWTKGASNWLPEDYGQAQWKRDNAARKALAKAGYSESNPVKIEYMTVEGYGKGGLYNESIVSQWRRLPGVEVEIVSLDWMEFTRRYLSGDFQVMHSAWLAAFNDPAAFLLLGGRLSPYSLGVMDDDYDVALQKAMSETSQEERKMLYQNLEQQLVESNSIIPLKHLSQVHWLQPRVKGFTATNPEGWVTSRQLRLE